jgi:hypothetical protein
MKTLSGIILTALLLCSCGTKTDQGNAIFVIAPHKVTSTWVIDDESRGLKREPFVAGIPKLLDQLTQDIPNAEKGFRLLFSAQSFPGHTHKMIWKRKDGSGNWYYSQEFKTEGWLCPALLKFFPSPPKEIYIKTESIEEKDSQPKSDGDGKPAP